MQTTIGGAESVRLSSRRIVFLGLAFSLTDGGPPSNTWILDRGAIRVELILINLHQLSLWETGGRTLW